MQKKNGGFLGPLWDNITCVEQLTGKQRPLQNVTIRGCGKLGMQKSKNKK